MFRFAILTTLAAALAGVARAESCPPSVHLAGEPELVAAVTRELGARGISIAVDERCPSPRANVAWRGADLVVVIDNPDGSSVERAVGEVGTAATVIESFTRTDVAMPLLATRSFPAPPPPAPPPPPPPRHPEQSAPASAPRQIIHLSAGLESAFANDGTSWMGASAKICIMAGPVCATARFRFSKVISGLDSPGVKRDLDELLIGVDVPIALGRFLLTPGVAGGIGGMDTRADGMERETGAFRAEAQVSLSVPIATKLALEVSLGAGLGDQYDFEGSPSVVVPPEPWVVFRAGVGLRYGKR